MAEQITQLLLAWRGGNPAALEELMPLVYDEMRAIAGKQLRRESNAQTLSSTVIVHEAYLRLIDQSRVDWKSRQHFFGVAARLVRQILVDHARARLAEKRGGGMIPLPLDENIDRAVDGPLELLALDEALRELGKVDEFQVRIVELRYFSGLTVEETAEALDIEVHQVKREWTMARAWLYRHLKPLD